MAVSRPRYSLGTAAWLVVRAQCTDSILPTVTLPSPAPPALVETEERGPQERAMLVIFPHWLVFQDASGSKS